MSVGMVLVERLYSSLYQRVNVKCCMPSCAPRFRSEGQGVSGCWHLAREAVIHGIIVWGLEQIQKYPQGVDCYL